MTSLYDVFCAIRDDEGDHVSTMHACLDPTANLSLEKKVFSGIFLAAAVGYYLSMGGDAVVKDGSAATGLAEPLLAGITRFLTTIAESIGVAQ
jgi:hypothetical protein